MQIQTVFKAGNSNVVAIPKDISKELGLNPGQKVTVEKTEGDQLVIKKVTRVKKEEKMVDEDFKKWWRAFLKDNAEILDELALR